MKKSAISQNSSYTFFDYFKMNADFEEIVSFWNFGFQVDTIILPQSIQEIENLPEIERQILDSFSRVSLDNESARREALISPILLEVARISQSKVRIEYPIEVSPQLKGTLDYLLFSESRLLVVEAKNEDLYRGFKQLAAEMIAVQQWAEDDSLQILYGAVSSGNLWQFGKLDVANRLIYQDLKVYDVPAELKDLIHILVGILERK
jgi:hypothetical protein